MRTKATLTGLMLLASAGAAIAQTSSSGPTEAPTGVPLAAAPSRPNPHLDNELKQRNLQESERRDRRRESRLKRVMGSVCGGC